MLTWWSSISSLNQAFYVVAVFFSTLFMWQLVASVASLGDGQADVGTDTDTSLHVDGANGVDAGTTDGSLVQDAVGLQTFRMLSIRSLLAFGMLSSWAGALYLQRGASSWLAILYAVLWGLAGMLVVGLFFWLLPRLSEEGTAQLGTAVGRTGQVYMDIPKDGVGQVRILVGNTIKFVKARSVSGEDLPAGTAVRAVKTLDSVTLEVERVES